MLTIWKLVKKFYNSAIRRVNFLSCVNYYYYYNRERLIVGVYRVG